MTSDPPRNPPRIDQTVSDEGPEPHPPLDTRPWLFVVYGNDRSRHIELRPSPLTIGRGEEANIVLHDDRVSKVHCTVRVTDQGAVEVTDHGSRNGTFIDGNRVTTGVLAPKSELRIGQTVMRMEHKDAAQVKLEEEMYRAAVTDLLTEVPNRRTFVDRATIEVSRAHRYGVPVSVLFIDVDHFKKVNDTYGHPAGDAVLKEVARRLNSYRRTEDLLCRYGGEEFVLLACCASLDQAAPVADRLRSEIEARPVESGEHRIAVTISAGVALLRPGESLEALLARADAALYRAKEKGRNRIEKDL